MRGIELPAGTEDLKNSGGFYIANKAVFTTDNPARDWDMFTAFLSVQVKKALPLSTSLPHYEDTKGGRKAYVFAENDRMKLIVDGQTEYTAVFLTAAGFMPEHIFNTYLETLKNILDYGYKGFVFKRINYRKVEKV